MGLLESIGRSGAVGQFGQNMFNNALQYGQFSQQSQESQMRQKIMDQKLAEQERMNRPVLLSELVGKGTEKGRPNFMKVFADAAKLAGAKRIILPDGSEDYTLAQADLPAVQKFMEMQKDMHPQLQWATYQDNLQMIPELQKQREKAKTPVEQMQIDEQIEAMKAENAGILTEFGKGEASKRSLVKVNEGGKPIYMSHEEAEGKEAYQDTAATDIRREMLLETQRHNRELERISREKLHDRQNELSFGDKEALRSMGKQLPKSKAAAETAVKNIQKIDRMIDLINRGAGGVRGELIARINKVADMMRRTSPEDAKYNTLKAELRGFAGQLRLQLGLVGQTSDRDVAIMYEAAGGSNPAESQRAILNGYRQGFLQDILNYNSDAGAYGEYSKAGKNLYKPIPVPEAPDPKMEWIRAAKAMNPGASDQELSEYYDKKYGGQ